MYPIFKRILFEISKSKKGQERIASFSNYLNFLMGIGSGSPVSLSGEVILAKRLKKIFKEESRELCVFDVGASKGLFIDLLIKNLDGTDYFIHAFEPSKDSIEGLEKKYYQDPRIIINPFALGSMKENKKLFFNKSGSTLSSFSKRRLDHLGISFDKSEIVQVETLDNYCLNNQIDYIDLLKLDVEGYELDVLNGAAQCLSDRKIKTISFEFGGCNIDSKTFFQDFFYFLKKNGYNEIFRITPSGYILPIKKYKEELEQFKTSNYFALLS